MHRGSNERAQKHIALVTSGVPGSMGRSVEQGFLALGCRVTFVPYTDWFPRLPVVRFRGAGLANKGLARLVRPALEARLVAELARARPDLVFFLKCDDLHAATYRAIRATTRATLMAFHPDDPWNLATLTTPGPAHVRSGVQMRSVDHMFLWSHALVVRARREGATASYLPFACDPALHPKVDDLSADERRVLGSDVCFIGNWDAEREAWLAPLADAGLGLTIWGTGYWATRCRHPGLQRAWQGRPLFAREQAAAATACAVLVNVLRRQNKGSCNMRTFEIPCTGGFMLHERSSEAAALFPPGVACGDFASPEELVSATRRWLADPEGRQRIAAEGHRRALSLTYREWAETVLLQLDR